MAAVVGAGALVIMLVPVFGTVTPGLARARRGMSRKSLSRASGVSERYLAELERGAGNASLLVLR